MEIEDEYIHLEKDISCAASSKNPLDKRLVISACYLALIKVLDQHGQPYESIREICLEIAEDYVRPKNRLEAFMKRIPAVLIRTKVFQIIMEYMDRRIRGREHPEGFVSRILTDKQETYGLGYGVDILECGICKLFAKHHYDRFAPILCEVDFITTKLAGLKLVRSGTIANGAEKCDFRFKVKNPD